MPNTPTHSIERAHDLLRSRRGALDALLRPCSVAIVGASEAPGSVGLTLTSNLVGSSFGGKVYLVNPRRSTVLDQACYKSLADVPKPIDLAVIAVPAPLVPSVIDECLRAEIQGAIVISAGFKEAGPAGASLEAQIRSQIAGGKLRLIGPNCLGVMSPVTGLNATFASSMARPGNLAFISQSGALLTAILDWSAEEGVGFSYAISIGSMLDVGWGDLIDFLGDDPHTSSIVIYMESIGDARSFLSAAREVVLHKPIIVIKAGCTELAAKAATSHTGSLASSDDVLDAAFQRAGVIRVRRISELFNLAEVLAKQPRPRGPQLAIVTNAGGPGVLATDALIEIGGKLATLSPATIEALDQSLPAHWSHANPVDVLGDAGPDRIADCAHTVAGDAACDGVLVILTPQAMTDPAETARKLLAHSAGLRKPLLASWMGGSQVAAGVQILNAGGIPTFPYPDSAARAFQYMWRYSDSLRALYETPTLQVADDGSDAQRHVSTLLQEVLGAGRTLLTEPESKQLLVAYGIPTVDTHVAASAAEAVQCARAIGYPVVLKLLSTTITHKTDVGGVELNLQSDDEVTEAFGRIATAVERIAGPGNWAGVTVQPMIRREGYELIVGSKIDPQFGPVILFGCGGQLVEVFKDRALGLPPLTSTLARRMMEHTKIYAALQGVRGRVPVDVAALEQLLVRFSQLVIEQPRIREIDINPLLASSGGLLALDARVVLHPRDCSDENLPGPVIRPYPHHYAGHWRGKDGTHLFIRPIRPEDEPLLAQFHATLSEQTVYARYAQLLSLGQRVIHERLARLCFIDYDRQIALVAIDEQQSPQRMVAVARLIKLYGKRDGEFALVVSDAFQHKGLGSHLLARLVDIGRAEKLERIVGQVDANNRSMLAICRELGFQWQEDTHDTSRNVQLEL